MTMLQQRYNKALHPTAYSFVRSSLRFRRRVSLVVVPSRAAWWQLRPQIDKIQDMSVKNIERAITQLLNSELTQLVSWLEDYHHQIWDK
jgi:hypothetical protein